MAELTSPLTVDEVDSGPSRKRKRSYVACFRCHAHKVKCFGGQPCQRCQIAKKGATCEYPLRERKISISESYLKELQGGRQSSSVAGRRSDIPDASASQASTGRELRSPSQGPANDRDIRNPLLEPRNLLHIDQGSRQQFVGESTCAAFGDLLLQCLNLQAKATPAGSDYKYTQNPTFARQLGDVDGIKLPERIRANLLVRVTLRFIGQDYHFFMQSDFLHQLEKAYSSRESHNFDATWACKFFVVLALGELYSVTAPTREAIVGESAVPGTDFFLTAVKLLQDRFEEPSTAQVEIMLLFCFYSNALGRVKSAHMYSGLALRISMCLGLHRSLAEDSLLTPVQREHRIRLWWTVYIFDRSTSSRLGQPLAIQDADIDVEMPSMDKLPPEAHERFTSPAHLIANVELSCITGAIMRDIYGLTAKSQPCNFVHNVRTILRKLRNWDSNVAPGLRLSQSGAHRPVASLQLHFNQCIILTTRPVLLHVLKVKKPFDIANGPQDRSTTPVSETAKTLADACISAARTSNNILSQLYVENALATYGYFDAHHLFSSTLVLIISAIISPNPGDSDAVQTAFHLLKTMHDNGNMAAAQYYSRLAHIQWTVGRLRARATAPKDSPTSQTAPFNPSNTPTSLPDVVLMEEGMANGYEWHSTADVPSAPFASYNWTGVGDTNVDPLNDPLLQTFLDHTDPSWGEDLSLTTAEMNSML